MVFLVFDGPLGKIGTWRPSASFPHCFCVCLTYWSLNSQSGVQGCAGSQGQGWPGELVEKEDVSDTVDSVVKGIEGQRKGEEQAGT